MVDNVINGKNYTVLPRLNVTEDLVVDGNPGMSWGNNWEPERTFAVGTMVNDNNWLMVANKETQERAAPQPIGTPTFSLPDNPAFVTQSNTSAVLSGNIYTLTRDGWARSVRVWVPEVGLDILHQLIITETTPEGVETLSINNLANLTANAWNLVGIGNRVYQSGTVIQLLLLSIDSSGTVSFNAFWNFNGVGNSAPLNGGWVRNSSFTTTRFHKSDADGGDQTANLGTVTVGTIINCISTVDNDRSNSFLVNSVQENASDFQYNTTGQGSGPGGSVEFGERTSVDFIVPSAQSTSYSEISGFWPGNQPDWATVTGFLSFDSNQSQVKSPNDDAYGTDLEFQIGAVSDDWDFASNSDFSR